MGNSSKMLGLLRYRRFSSVDMSLVKQLRSETKAGVMLCRDSLVEANNDIEKAREILRSKGVKTREGKVAAEGVVEMSSGPGYGFAVEICCETDFVARGSSVASLANKCSQIGVEAVQGGKEDLYELVKEGTKDLIEDAMRVTGERVEVRNVWGYHKPGSFVSGYLHAPSGLAKIVGMVALEKEHEQLAKKLAVQITAMKPATMEELLNQPFGAWNSTTETVEQVLKKEKINLEAFGRLE